MDFKLFKKVSVTTISLLMLLSCSSLASTTGKVNTNGVRLRAEANTTSTIITNVYENDNVEILETSGDWYKISINGKQGYIKKEFVDSKSSNSSSNTNVSKTNTTTSNTTKNSNTSSSYNTSTNTTNTNTSSVTNTTNTTTATNTVSSNNAASSSNANEVVTIVDIKVRRLPNMLLSESDTIVAGSNITKTSEYPGWCLISSGKISGWIPEVKFASFQSNVNNNDNNETKTDNTVATANTITNTTVNNAATNTSVNNTTTSSNNATSTSGSAVNKKAKVTVETAKIREKASSSAEVVGFLDLNDVISITAEEGEWYKFTSGDQKGYVNKSLVKVIADSEVSSRGEIREEEKDTTFINPEENAALTEMLSNVSTSGAQVVDYAKQYLGYSYVVGGKNPNTGFDCSGFTRYVFLNFGYSLGTTAASQNNLGTVVDRNNIQPGDLILFYDEGKTKIGHTGIYIGNGEFIHSANPERGVVIDNLNTNSYYNSRYVEARKIV